MGLADQTTTAALQVGTGCVVAEAEVMYIACARDVHRLVRLRQAEHELLHHKLALHGPPVGAPVLDPLHRVAGGALTRQSEGGVLQVALTLC